MIMKKILFFIDYYLPGYRAGGPVQTLSNMVKMLGNEIDFYIVTRDRDLGDEKAFPNVEVNKWVKVNNANVIYFSDDQLNFRNLLKIVRSDNWSYIYLNSFFSWKFSIQIIILAKLFSLKSTILLSPKGEFSLGALKIKKFKKKLYLTLANLSNLYNTIIWHLTSEQELRDLESAFNRNKLKYRIAMDPVDISDISYSYQENVKLLDECRVVFISRVSQKKNLHLCIECFIKNPIPVIFDIYGPIEDENYWSHCKYLLAKVDPIVKIKYCGVVDHKNIYNILKNYHCLFLPTAGENFGYIIFEALLAGRPVLIGDATPWNDLKSKEIGVDADPEDFDVFVNEIKRIMSMNQAQFNNMAEKCHNYALAIGDPRKQIINLRALFS